MPRFSGTARLASQPADTFGSLAAATRTNLAKASVPIILAALLTFCSAAPEPSASVASKPNIILIMADDLGTETIGAYGGTSYKTPILDGLASSGIRFTRAYAQPLCTPTRLQLMTGKYNPRNWKAFGVMSPDERTFGHMMSEAGYATLISGKWQLHSYNPPDFEPEWRGKGMTGDQAGFDQWLLWHAYHTEDKGSRYGDPTIADNGEVKQYPAEYGPDVYTERITDFIDQNADKPFFIYYPMALTHGPFNPTPLSDTWESDNRLENDEKYFGDMVEYMDVVVGRIIDKLNEHKLRENTLVLFFSDNGSPWTIYSETIHGKVKGGKGEMNEAGTRVPLIANWPGVGRMGLVIDDLIDSTDFYPTIAEIAGIDIGNEGVLDGRSFAPQLRGEPGQPREWVFFHHDPRPGWSKKGRGRDRWIGDANYKLFDTNRFYTVDPIKLEETEIPPDEMTPEMKAAAERLRKVLDTLPDMPPTVPPGTPGY
jgi:arylsulfatase A